MSISIEIDASGIERKATTVYVPFKLTNTSNHNDWDSLVMLYNDSGNTSGEQPAQILKTCTKYISDELSCYAIIPNVKRYTIKNTMTVQIVGTRENGTVYNSNEVTIPWTESYSKKTVKLSIVSVTRKKQYLNVVFNAINYYANKQAQGMKWQNLYVDYKKTTENNWSTVSIDKDLIWESNQASVFSYDLKDGWVTPVLVLAGSNNDEDYVTKTMKRCYVNITMPYIITDKTSAYDVRVRGSLENAGPDNIYQNITSASKTILISNYYANNLISLNISSADIHPVVVSLQGGNYKKMTRISINVELINRTGNDWEFITLNYRKDDDDDITVINLINLSDGKQTFAVPLEDNFENDSTYIFWLEGQVIGYGEDLFKTSECLYVDTLTHKKAAQSLVRLYQPSNDTWWNLTPLIKVPNYNVMNNWVTEEWDDANYTTHTVGIRQRIEGEFQLSFEVLPIADEDVVGDSNFAPLNPREAYYKFLDLLRLNFKKYGPNRVKMCVHMNNTVETDLTSSDYETYKDDYPLPYDDLPYAKCKWKNAIFYIKISEIPWQIPWYDMPNKEIEPIKITIKEE